MTRRSINFSSKVERVWKWLFPTVLIALAPVLAQYLLNLFNWGFTQYSFQDLVVNISPHGELLIIAVALVAESVSEMWRRQISGWQKDCIGTLCIFFVIIATFTFSGLNPAPSNAIAISSKSFDLFLIGLGLCITCKIAGRS